jgi:hypothetical protein
MSTKGRRTRTAVHGAGRTRDLPAIRHRRLALSRLDAEDVAKDVEWPTLISFAGLFIMVGGQGQHAHHREVDAGRRPLRSGRWRATGTAG